MPGVIREERQVSSAKGKLWTIVAFVVGVGVGIPGGMLINDLLEKENEATMEEICAEFQTQENLDSFFEGLERGE